MKINKLQIVILSLTLSFLSCSKSTNSDESPADHIVGEWLFISENDYYCGTDEVALTRLGSDQGKVQTKVFTAKGNYMNYDNGVLETAEDQIGTWEYIGSGLFKFNYTINGQPETNTIEIDFNGENIMNFDIDSDCFDFGSESLFTYSVFNRQ